MASPLAPFEWAIKNFVEWIRWIRMLLLSESNFLGCNLLHNFAFFLQNTGVFTLFFRMNRKYLGEERCLACCWGIWLVWGKPLQI